MVANFLPEMLQQIHAYYPVGLPNVDTMKEKRESFTVNKITELIDKNETPWSRLVSEVERNYKKEQVFDMAYLQFPNYVLTIELPVKTLQGHVTYKRHVVLTVSLLCRYYTLFYEDEYRFLHLNRIPGTFRIIFTEKSAKIENTRDHLAVLSDLMAVHFPESKMMPHMLPMSFKIEGSIELPSAIGSGPHSMYHYLFNGFFNEKNVEIRE